MINLIQEEKFLRDLEDMTNEEREEAVKENPLYGNIVCRCEMVTEAEIVDAIRRPLGARIQMELREEVEQELEDVKQALYS